MHRLLSGAAGALSLCATMGVAQDGPAFPAQSFTPDPSHTTLVFSLNHLGLSEFTAGFDSIDGSLQLDPADPTAAALSISIDVASIDLPSPPDGFREELLGANFFDAGNHPNITFESESIEMTGDTTATVTGQLTLHGVTQPVEMAVTFNGNTEAGAFEPWTRIGFSAQGELSRTAFGMGFGVPPEGSTIGVGDTVSFVIETEWTGEAIQ